MKWGGGEKSILYIIFLLLFFDLDKDEDDILDESMPIDVLFYGNMNGHRFSVFETFMELSKEYSLDVIHHIYILYFIFYVYS